MCTKQFINAFNSLTLKDLKEFIPEDVWESVVDSIDWKGLVLKGASEPNEKVNDRSERMRQAAKARWEKTKATKADEVTTTVVEPKEEVVTPDVVEDITDVVEEPKEVETTTVVEPEPYVEPIAVEKMEDVLMQQEETLKEEPEVVETPEVVDTPKSSPEPLIKKQEVYTYQNTGNPYLYRPVEDAATPEQKNVDEQWQLFDKAAWELKDSTNVAQLEQFLLKMDTWWKKFGTMELNPDYNMAHHLIKNRIADLKGIPV